MNQPFQGRILTSLFVTGLLSAATGCGQSTAARPAASSPDVDAEADGEESLKPFPAQAGGTGRPGQLR